MDEFPPNRHVDKQALKAETEAKKLKKTPIEEKSDGEKETIKPVVTGKVIRRKRSVGTRIRELLFSSDTDTVKDYILNDVLIPALKNTISDATSGGLDRLLYGDGRAPARRTNSSFGRGSHVSYDTISSRQDAILRRSGGNPESRRDVVSTRGRSSRDLDEIILATRIEAETVLTRLEETLARYQTVSVADLYDLLDITRNYTDDRWGWYDLGQSEIRRVRAGYLLRLPNPEPLD